MGAVAGEFAKTALGEPLKVDWQKVRGLPPSVAAAMAWLQGAGPKPEPDAALATFLDLNQLTLAYDSSDARAANNALRVSRLRAEYKAIAERLTARGVDHVVLKGFSHQPPLWPDPALRMQFDIDLFVEPEDLPAAAEVLTGLGFEAAKGQEKFPTDHLPPFVRRTGWQWRGDFFDPEIPPVVEVHHRLWDPATEGFLPPGVGEFWQRRQGHALAPSDRLGYACLHLLRHWLRGSVKAFHVWELSVFLRQADAAFWEDWRRSRPLELRRLESLALQLAARWFDAPLPAQLAPLPPRWTAWLDWRAAAPLVSQFRPEKSEVWLHLELLAPGAPRWPVLRRKFLPVQPPGAIDGAYDRNKPALGERLRRGARYGAHLTIRAARHVSALPLGLRDWLGWRRVRNPTRGSGRPAARSPR